MNRLRPATSNQPQTDETLKIYSSKSLPTIRVKLKGSDDDRVLTINAANYDPGRYVRLD